MHTVEQRPLASCAFVLAGVLAMLAPPPALAQQLRLDQALEPSIPGDNTEPGVSVASRRHPEYDYSGVRLGSYLVLPELSESIGYDDNVLGTRNAKGSLLVQSRADVQVRSDLSRYGVSARITVDDYRFVDHPRQSLTNWTAMAGGSYEIGRDTVTIAYSHANLNQTPRDLNVPLLDESIAYRIDTVRLGYRAVFNRLSLRPGLVVSNYDFDNGTVAGARYLQTYRNRVTVSPDIVAAYELAPRRNIVVVVNDLNASYTNRPAGFVNRDFNDVSAMAGIDYDTGGLWRFRLLGGYEVRTFNSAALKTIEAPIAEASVIFSPTGLTTLTGTVARRIQDSADETTVGFTESSVKLVVDHEYLRNVVLTGRAQATFDDYKGGGNQMLYTLGAGANYLLNRNMRLAATYDHTSLQSSSSLQNGLGSSARLPNNFAFTSGYNENRFLLQLRLGL